MLNRVALIVRPAKPFLEWAANLDDSGVLPDPDDEQTVYLIPSFETDQEQERVLRTIYAEVFENELHGWHTVESAWPRNRTLAMFRRWFKIEIHTVVEDLCAYPIEDDEPYGDA